MREAIRLMREAIRLMREAIRWGDPPIGRPDEGGNQTDEGGNQTDEGGNQMGRSSNRPTSQRDRHAVVAAQCGREEMQFVTAILEIAQLGMARCWPVHARHERIAATLQRHSVPVARGDQQRRPTRRRELRRPRNEAVNCGRDALRRRLPPVLERVFGGGLPGNLQRVAGRGHLATWRRVTRRGRGRRLACTRRGEAREGLVSLLRLEAREPLEGRVLGRAYLPRLARNAHRLARVAAAPKMCHFRGRRGGRLLQVPRRAHAGGRMQAPLARCDVAEESGAATGPAACPSCPSGGARVARPRRATNRLELERRALGGERRVRRR